MQDIVKYFTKAKLKCTLSDRPIVNLQTGANDIFQMTIDSGKRERFRIFKGHRTNDVRVLDYDSKKQQILLYVKEPKRTFAEKVYDYKLRKNVEVKRETSEGIRRFLMGNDERHLFIAELPDRSGKVNKVNDAFRILKPYDVKDRKKRKGSKVYRQGEWFFLEATKEELEDIKLKHKFIMHNEPIVLQRSGKPHIAERLLRIEGKIFVIGKVRHVDHKTKHFFNWHRVFRNTERVNNIGANGIGWID